jgi:metallophosphoesterase superfamily enzyme
VQNDVSLHECGYRLNEFFFSHYPDDQVDAYNIAGHLHPGIRLVGDGLQSLKLPAFLFGNRQGLLPSFGTFTGISIINPKPGDQVVAISNETLVRIETESAM